MKKIYILFLILFSIFNVRLVSAQAGQWTWIHGSNTTNSAGNFGTQGVPSQTNEPPALYEACEWTDLNGKFWFYGGLDNTTLNIHNDLWKFDPVDSTWTWIIGTHAYNDSGNFGVQGVAAATNRPPSLGYGTPTWTDLNGNLWLFGGVRHNNASYYKNDLWKYDISTNEWTWIKGSGLLDNQPGVYGTQGVPDSANIPPARAECAAAWTDNNGDLWLFGGYIGTMFNDLWRYNIASNSWTWMKGPNTGAQHGVWGTIGVEAPTNVPSSRWVFSHWKDKSGNFWIFGGNGLDVTGAFWPLSDMWRYNPATNNWTWMEGVNTGGSSGIYGTKCGTSGFNEPPARYESRASWRDANGDFWMFGGLNGNSSGLNDLWKYCVAVNAWTWEGGDNTANAPGSWGTKYVASPSNKPDARIGDLGWTDGKGHLYLFGGSAATSFGSMYNDLWRFTIDTSCGSYCQSIAQAPPPVAAFQSNKTNLCTNDCIDFTDQSTNNPISWNWSFPGGMPVTSSDQNPTVCYLDSGVYNVTLTVSNSGGSDSLQLGNYINVLASPLVPTVALNGNTLHCSTDPSYTSYQWLDSATIIPGATDTFLIINHSGNYNLQVSNKNGCKVAVGINVILGLKDYLSENNIHIYTNPVGNQLIIRQLTDGQLIIEKIEIYNTLGQVLFKSEIRNRKSEIEADVSFLSSGIYFVRLIGKSEGWIGRFVKE